MRLSIRLTTLAITAVALAGALGAQQRPNAHVGARSQPARSQADNRARSAVRPQQYASSRADVRGSRTDNQPRNDPRGGNGYAARPDPRGGNGYAARPDPRGGNGYAARPDPRGGNGYAGRPDPRGGNGNAGRPDPRGGNNFRGGDDHRVPVAAHGRPLITRGYAQARGYGGSSVYAETRFGGSRGFVPRGGLPFGWESRVVYHSFFPMAYAGYCEAVPLEYEYMLPPMAPSYDPCLFGDRVIVFDRFSRSIVFVATL